MKLIAISQVRNELDIIEAFVRHHCRCFDQLIIVDDGSSDGTYEVLLALQAAGLPLVVMSEPSVGYEQSRRMSRIARMAVHQCGADWIMPLDADEFVEPDEGTTLAQVLHSRGPELLRVPWNNFVWQSEDDEDLEPNPVLRLRCRMPSSPDHLDKVLVPAKLVADDVAELGQGNHQLLRNAQALSAQRLNGVCLCHFPVRTVAQYASKVVVGYLQYSTMPDWSRDKGFQYIEPFRLLTQGINQLARFMAIQSRRYSLEERWTSQGEPKEAPLRYLGGPLSLTTRREAMLTNVLCCAEAIANKLAECARQKEELRQALLATEFRTQVTENHLKSELDGLRAESERHRTQIREMHNSTSWQLTAPLRMIGRNVGWLRRLVGRAGNGSPS